MYADKKLKNDDVEVMLFLGLMKLTNELCIILCCIFAFIFLRAKFQAGENPGF